MKTIEMTPFKAFMNDVVGPFVIFLLILLMITALIVIWFCIYQEWKDWRSEK